MCRVCHLSSTTSRPASVCSSWRYACPGRLSPWPAHCATMVTRAWRRTRWRTWPALYTPSSPSCAGWTGEGSTDATDTRQKYNTCTTDTRHKNTTCHRQ